MHQIAARWPSDVSEFLHECIIVAQVLISMSTQWNATLCFCMCVRWHITSSDNWEEETIAVTTSHRLSRIVVPQLSVESAIGWNNCKAQLESTGQIRLEVWALLSTLDMSIASAKRVSGTNCVSVRCAQTVMTPPLASKVSINGLCLAVATK